MILILCLGMFHNPEQANYASLAHQYITLSRASLATECIYVNTSITAIDAMILHINYFETSDDPGGAAKAWATLGTTMKLAQSVRYNIHYLKYLTEHHSTAGLAVRDIHSRMLHMMTCPN